MGLRLRRRRAAGVMAAAALAAGSLAASAAAAPRPVDLQILSFNDYHGNLEPPTGGNATLPGRPSTELYGGAAYLSQTLTGLRTGKRNTLTVAAGDLIGASPIVSGLFKDEPSVETLNAMRLDVSSVGNHEFDEGITELLRMQYGGCSPEAGCFDADGYSGAKFPWLAANVTWKPGVLTPKPVPGYGSWFRQRTGRTVLPPTWVKEIDDIKVGFIGMTLRDTPTLVAQAGIKDLDFKDEVASANLAARDLRQRNVQAIIVLIHEGGLPPNGSAYDYQCNAPGTPAAISGPIVAIAQGLDPSIDMVISGHTHQPYVCNIPDPAGNPRLVTSAYAFGRLVTETNLQLDRRTKDVIRTSVSSRNVPVTRAAADPVVAEIVSRWQALAAPIASREVGRVTADIRRGATRDVESSLANLIADAQLERTRVNGAQIALMNPGGVRADLLFAGSPTGGADGVVTYGEMFLVQPFGNTLVTMTLTGAQLKTVLEQQYALRTSNSNVESRLTLGVSKGLTFDMAGYSGTTSAGTPNFPGTPGNRIGNIRLDGTPIDPAATYRVTVNSFLADGGDSFVELKNGTNRTGGGQDLDEFIAYLAANSPVAPAPIDRINELP
ncbi:MAG: bifunctional metallophosphatase/5'-nucleotidase [Thermoleophilia bacterium]